MRLPRHLAFWALAAILTVFLFAAAAPSPLYVVYQARFGFSATTLTAIFAVYALALLAALLVVGSLSDHVGRRPVLAGALVVEALAMVAFAGADAVGWLFAARALQGFATGTATATIGAGLIDLAPPENPRRGALVNSTVATAGLAAGAIGSGLLVQYGPSPERLVFVALGVAFAIALAALALLPEPATRRAGALASLRPAAAVPRRIRPAFAVVAPILIATWALGGLYLSLGPSLAAGVLGMSSHLVGGVVVATLTGAGSLASVIVRDVDPRRVMVCGALALALGVAVTLVALGIESRALFFVGTATAGAGFGSSFLGAFRTLADLAEPTERAGLLTVIYVVSYLAFSLPAVAAGLAVTQTGLLDTADAYGATIIALALAAVGGFAVEQRRARALSCGVG